MLPACRLSLTSLLTHLTRVNVLRQLMRWSALQAHCTGNRCCVPAEQGQLARLTEFIGSDAEFWQSGLVARLQSANLDGLQPSGGCTCSAASRLCFTWDGSAG